MAEYVNEDKPIIFKNETDSDFNVGVGIVFRKSGIYEISINDKTTIVTKVSERKTGRWIDHAEEGYVECPFCHSATNCDDNISELHFCFSCGARMEENEE